MAPQTGMGWSVSVQDGEDCPAHRTAGEQGVDIEQCSPNEPISAAEADLQRQERRWTYVYLILFTLVTTTLIFIWLDRTAGERACTRWMENGEPRLEAVTIKMTSYWRRVEVTCDDEEALRYFEDSLASAIPWTPAPSSYYRNECTVVLRFANGAEYHSPGPCEITTEGIRLALPSKSAGTGLYSFPDPMPDGWKRVLHSLLGVNSVK